MKKLFTFISAATVLGLGFIATQTVDVDAALGVDKTEEQTYIVETEGDLTDGKAKADLTRKEVINEVKYLLDEDSYDITSVYDTIYNGFAIKTTEENARLISKVSGVASVQRSHTYAVPETTTGTDSSSAMVISADELDSVSAMKLGNYSAETMKATATNVQEATGATSLGGKNVTIGIIDTGLYMNQVEGTTARTTLEADTSLTDKILPAAFKDLSDGTYTYTEDMVTAKSLGHSFTHVNNKIFYAYDYVGDDTDVDPTSSGSNHGTHVASLAAANGDVFQGIAPNAQVAVMKVFGDNEAGAPTDAIIDALDDAAKLGLDVINLSLGSDLYDYDDSADNATYKAIKACEDANVIVNFAAGNSGKSSFSSSDGYADYTTDTVEPGILGSDANFDEAANVVASSNPDKAYYSSVMLVQKNGSETESAVSYKDQVITSTSQNFNPDRYLTDLLTYDDDGDGTSTSHDTRTVDYVYIPGYGTKADFEAVGGADTVTGKVAVVNRGQTTFVAKTKNAQKYGAIALIVINNDPSVSFNFSMDFNDYQPNIPVCFVFQNTRSTWGTFSAETPASTDDGYGTLAVANGYGTLTLAQNSVQDASDGNTITYFSSDGPSYNLDIDPTVAAPGGQIIGAVSADAANEVTSDTLTTGISGIYGYEFMSGTSMAAPNFTGAIALALGEKNPTNGGALAVADETAYTEYKQKISYIAMSTADQLLDSSKDSENSVRLQGAGRVNVESILKADSYVTTTNTDLDGFANETTAKAELKNTGDLYVENADFANTGEDYLTFEYTIHNDSNTARTYSASMSVMIPSLRIQETHDSYAAEEPASRTQTVGYDSSVTFDENDLSTYPTFVGTPTMSVNDDTLTDTDGDGYEDLDGTITVAAGGTATATAKIRIDNLKVNKDWDDSKVDNVSNMDLKDYLNTYFKDAGGTFVEGFLKLTPTDSSDEDLVLTMPYLGFYGDYTVGAAVEDFDFEKDSSHIYNSDLVDNYFKNLNSTYAKPSVYSGSTISASGSALSQTMLDNYGAFNRGLQANGNDLLSVQGTSDDLTHLYAGATGVADHIHAVFFVNRSISSATWTIKKGETVTKSGDICDFFDYGTYTMNDASAGLSKSWIVTDSSSTAGSGYAMHHGMAEIDVSDVDAGDYTLEFNFTLRATGTTQTKSYTLTIDKEAPEFKDFSFSTTSSGKQRVTVEATGANSTISIGSTNLAPDAVADEDDTYTATATVSTKDANVGRVVIEMTDFAHNVSYAVISTSTVNSAIYGTGIGDVYNYILSVEDKNDHVYGITFVNAAGNDTTVSSDYYLYIRLDKNLDASDIEVKVDNAATTDFTYDADTGFLKVHMAKDSFAVEINQTPVDMKDNTDNTSSSTSDTSSSSSTTEESKGGCGGSVIAATSVVGALALATVAFALKKKKEDK